ncbi:MAG: YdeI/OmpD-associated family protein, partial [Nitrospirota bacterium]
RPGEHEENRQSPQAAAASPAGIRAYRAYRQRIDGGIPGPPSHRNDSIGWITRAKLPATRNKRLAQMLDELRRGGISMKMVYRPKRIAQDRSRRKGPSCGVGVISPPMTIGAGRVPRQAAFLNLSFADETA